METPEANLVAGMQWLQGTYTQRFNRRHRQCGHLFQGRYKALLVESGRGPYFSTVSVYIHLNPARAGLLVPCRDLLEDYAWSSYPDYLKPPCRPAWLSVERVLGCYEFADDRKGRREYGRFMEQQAAEVALNKDRAYMDPQWSRIRRGWYFGSESFLESLLSRLDGIRSSTAPASLGGDAIQQHNEQQAEHLCEIGLARLGLSNESLKTLPKGAVEKRVLAWFIRSQTTVSNTWLSTHLHCGHSANLPGYIRTVDDATNPVLLDLRTRILKSED
ncbi:MAG: hypothetical protein JW993_14615 [Sedimentisphaerales bacterium]|nr:hypothetical protein [Sedimentisphaerales bacterium]